MIRFLILLKKRTSLTCLLLISFLIACNNKDNVKTGSEKHTRNKVAANGYVVPPEKIKPPVVTILKAPKEIKVTNPVIVKTEPEKYAVKDLHTKKLGQPIVCIPGQGSYKLPEVVPATNHKFLAALPDVLPAKSPVSKDQNPKNISTYGLLQGLKNLNIHVIKQDRFGNLWIATGFGGVCQYDGKNFTHFTEDQGLLSNNVRSIYFDEEDNIWFGTYHGISKFDGKYFTNYTKENGLAGNVAYGITEDKNGDMWFGTFDGLSKLDKKKNSFTNFTATNGLVDNGIYTLTTDDKGNIWIGTFKGLSILKLDEKNNLPVYIFNNYTTAQGLANNSIADFFEDAQHSMWLATEGGVSKISFTGDKENINGSVTNFTTANGLPDNSVACIMGEPNGNIWMGTEDGICIFTASANNQPGSFSYIKDKDGLPGNLILSLFNDSYNNVWIGSDKGGLSKYKGNTFRSYQKTEGLSDNLVSCMVEDRKGNMWIGTAKSGLIKYLPVENDGAASYVYYTTKEGLSSNFIYALHEDKKGNIWIGTTGGAITKFEPSADGITGIFKQYTKETGLPGSFVPSIIEDKKGNIWFGSMGGVFAKEGGACKISGDTLTYFGKEQGLVDEHVWSVAQDINGNFWFGTWGEGLTKYQPATANQKAVFTQYTTANGLMDNKVRPILADSKGNVWAGGIQGLGLTKFQTSPNSKNDSIEHYTTVDGITNNSVLSAIEDRESNIWLGNYYGLTRLSAEKGNTTTGAYTITNYTPENGFQGVGSSTNAMYQSSNGLIWVGTYDRLTVFDPENLKQDTSLPNVQLTDIALFNEKIDWSKDSSLRLKNGTKVEKFRFDSLSKWYNIPNNLSLAYNNNFINFHFVGIHINTPNAISYQYMLSGLEKNWSAPTYQTEASYGNLVPGSYIFEVRARNGNGSWTTPFAYSFVIRPPWWQTWWAYIGYAILFVALIYVFVRVRIQQGIQKVKAVEAIRTKISSDLHDDVGTLLSGLAMQSQMLAYTATGVDKEQLNEISNMSREAMEHMRDTVWAMDSRKDKYENLIDRMRAFAEKNLAMKKITHEFILENIDTKKFINPEKRQAIYLIFKEAITNIIKHSNGTHAVIKFVQEKNKTFLSVHDNGTKKETIKSDGSGVNNMKMRAEKIGGNLATQHENGYTAELVINN